MTKIKVIFPRKNPKKRIEKKILVHLIQNLKVYNLLLIEY